MKLLATRKTDQNRAALDPWTLVHFSAGLALGLIQVPRTVALSAATAYEVVEQTIERHPIGQDFFEVQGPESLANVIVDILVLAVGHRLGEMWHGTG